MEKEISKTAQSGFHQKIVDALKECPSATIVKEVPHHGHMVWREVDDFFKSYDETDIYSMLYISDLEFNNFLEVLKKHQEKDADERVSKIRSGNYSTYWFDEKVPELHHCVFLDNVQIESNDDLFMIPKALDMHHKILGFNKKMQQIKNRTRGEI